MGKSIVEDLTNDTDDLNREVATAKLIEALVKTEKKDIPVLTDLSPANVIGATALITFENWINENLDKGKVKIAENLVYEYRLNRISLKRKRIEELIKAIQKPHEDENKGFFSRLRGSNPL